MLAMVRHRPMNAMSLDHDGSIVKYQTPTRDAFLGGRLIIAQPRKGFRAGLDSVLLGASVRLGEGALLDLGAGVGTAALVALRQAPGLTAMLADADPAVLALAGQNIIANGFDGRARTALVDVTAPGATRRAAGLVAGSFATAVANPPFFAAGRGTSSGEPGRAAARQMPGVSLDLWVKTAAASAVADGEITFVMPAESLHALLAAFEGRLGAITVLPLSPRPGMPATRILVRGIKQSRAPLTLLAGRPIHAGEGNGFSPEIEAVLKGEQRFVW
jgi:tRNA1(Val) A37 N6-methylase TrmN6